MTTDITTPAKLPACRFRLCGISEKALTCSAKEGDPCKAGPVFAKNGNVSHDH
jgi:hypothetical protein